MVHKDCFAYNESDVENKQCCALSERICNNRECHFYKLSDDCDNTTKQLIREQREVFSK